MLKYSTGLSDFLMQNGSFKRAFEGGELQVRTGSQPSAADDAVSGTLLCTYTISSGARTAETRPAGSVTISGSSGSVNSITVAGYEILGATVAYDTSTTVTATNVATQINKYLSKGIAEFTASASSNKVTITMVQGSGNVTGTVVATCSTLTTSDVNVGTETAGVTSVNGLTFGTSTSGVLVKYGIWSGVAVATGTGGWFRLVGPITDGGSSSTTAIRLDGSVGTSGADLNLATTSLTSGNTYTIDTFTFTLPLTS
jgi:hypothetical protein